MKAILTFVAGVLLATTALASGVTASRPSIKHGKFLVDYGGCNDCHTPGWDEHNGYAPKNKLLTGGGFNFQGPWGTTYPINLRLYMQKLTVKEWIAAARNMKARPAMPGWTFRYLDNKDLADIYAYIHSLGPAGKPAHDYVPPGRTAPPPYLKLILPTTPVAAVQH